MSLAMNWEEQGNVVAKLIAQAWMDDGFKARLMREPLAVLKAAGILIPDGSSVEVVDGVDASREMVTSADAQGATTYSLNIPAKPSDLSDEDLSQAIANRSRPICSSCFCCV
jgi:hypothetical protein